MDIIMDILLAFLIVCTAIFFTAVLLKDYQVRTISGIVLIILIISLINSYVFHENMENITTTKIEIEQSNNDIVILKQLKCSKKKYDRGSTCETEKIKMFKIDELFKGVK